MSSQNLTPATEDLGKRSMSVNVKAKAAVVMLEDIDDWINNLIIETGTQKEDRNFKEQLKNKLIHKIGELNMDSEIFNDDFIYDDILGDEVEKLLADIPGENIKNNITPLRRELLALVKRSRKKIRKENEGRIYRQQLYETISNILPSFDLTEEGKAAFEILKDNVTDAYITMCYVDNDACEVTNLKKRINDEIHIFYNNYLKRCPASPVDTSKLNQALYNALRNVTEPPKECFREDVELVKIKEVINDWAKELPFENHLGQQKLHINKIIFILAQKIYDIENEKEFTRAEEFDDKMKKEIEKFLKKITITTENYDINEFIGNLVNILENTKESREQYCQPLAKEACEPMFSISCNNISASPYPADTCSQTFNFSQCSGPAKHLFQKCSSGQTPCKSMQAIRSQINVTPNVSVNDTHWDSVDESCIQAPRVPCPCPTTCHPPYSVMPLPIQSSSSLRGDERCMRPSKPPCLGSTTYFSAKKLKPQIAKDDKEILKKSRKRKKSLELLNTHDSRLMSNKNSNAGAIQGKPESSQNSKQAAIQDSGPTLVQNPQELIKGFVPQSSLNTRSAATHDSSPGLVKNPQEIVNQGSMSQFSPNARPAATQDSGPTLVQNPQEFFNQGSMPQFSPNTRPAATHYSGPAYVQNPQGIANQGSMFQFSQNTKPVANHYSGPAFVQNPHENVHQGSMPQFSPNTRPGAAHDSGFAFIQNPQEFVSQGFMPQSSPNIRPAAANGSGPTFVQNPQEFVNQGSMPQFYPNISPAATHYSGLNFVQNPQELVNQGYMPQFLQNTRPAVTQDFGPNLFQNPREVREAFPGSRHQSFQNSKPTKCANVKKKAAVVMLGDIANWVNNLKIESGTQEEAEHFKNQVQSKLMHKIAELNINSEIFNDDFIYDNILGDEIDNLLTDIPGEYIKNSIPALKRELLAIVKRARKKSREENEGQIYKQQLHDTISKTLPSFDLSVEGKASFEVLKDNVADAFISMCYVENDACEAQKLRQRINDEIYKFCNNYLKRCPASPVDTSKLNQALFNALRNISEPQNESFIENVKLVKIKNIISEWARELPLKNQVGQEKLHTNKFITLLANKLYDFENEQELIPVKEYEDNMRKEIAKFLKKVAMATDNDNNIQELVENLMKILKDTEESRKLNAFIIKYSQPLAKGISKARVEVSYNDASVNICPLDTYSQTANSSKYPDSIKHLIQKCSSIQTPCKKMQSVGSQITITPNIVVNEHHYDSANDISMQPSPVSCPVTSSSPCKCIPQSKETCGPVSRQESQSTATSLKSCLITQQLPNKLKNPCSCGQHQIRPPPLNEIYSPSDYEHDYQLLESTAPFRHKTDRTQAEKQPSNQNFGSILEENYFCQRKKQYPTTWKPQQTPSLNPPYSYHLTTTSVTSRPRPNSQNNQNTRQPCFCPISHEASSLRILQDSQSSLYNSPQNLTCQDNLPMTPSPNVTPHEYSQGQSNVPSLSTMCLSPPLQMPCTFDPRSPCYMRPKSSVTSEEYESGPNCVYQK